MSFESARQNLQKLLPSYCRLVSRTGMGSDVEISFSHSKGLFQALLTYSGIKQNKPQMKQTSVSEQTEVAAEPAKRSGGDADLTKSYKTFSNVRTSGTNSS